jgi:pre-mRNA-processing factor 6
MMMIDCGVFLEFAQSEVQVKEFLYKHISQMAYYLSLANPDFLKMQPPPNYIAGLGRGATGFTTRSDLGSAVDDGAAFAAAQALKEDDDQFKDAENESGLFSSLPYDADDEEADRIYDQVEKKMDERRRAKREMREQEELESHRKNKPTIQQQFQDLKKGLSSLTPDEWANIPDVVDMVRKRGEKKQKDEVYGRFSAVPDSILMSSLAQGQLSNTVSSVDQGIATPAVTDFNQFGEARAKVVGLTLDRVSDSVSGQTTIDPKGYLTDLGSVAIKTDSEISDIKKARSLLRSVITTNPSHGPGWIAAARLEEVANKLASAREIIGKGCEECQKNEDVWLEAARLNVPDTAKIILANAIRHIPLSVKIWLRAKDLESDVKAQKRVLRKALEYIPNSLALWKSAISCEEDSDDARILLARAVDCVPLAVDLWLALARLETYTNAEKIMNKARKANPNSHEIWIAAAKLQEQNDRIDKAEIAIKKAVERKFLDREQWLKECHSCEKEGFLGVLGSIIRHSSRLGVEEEDIVDTFLDDAENCSKEGHIETARAIYRFASELYPNDKYIWQDASFLEKAHGTKESLEATLIQAVEKCPDAEVLWLMYAKELWMRDSVQDAKSVLKRAFEALPNSEEIWLAAIKLEIETQQYEQARELLNSARLKANTERVWMKSAVLERILKSYDRALELLDQGIKQFPEFTKLWIIKGQIYEDDLKDIDSARSHFESATKRLPRETLLWILSSRLEESAGLPTKARAVLEKARKLNPKNAELWTEAVQVERRCKNDAMARALIAKALQECPHSGPLWCEMILMESRPQRKARSADALKNCENDPWVVCTVARLFWADRKLDTARKWFQRASKTNSDIGDIWAWWLKFEVQHGTADQRKEVISKCVAAEPRHGIEWPIESKRLSNIGKKPEDILNLLLKRLSVQL